VRPSNGSPNFSIETSTVRALKLGVVRRAIYRLSSSLYVSFQSDDVWELARLDKVLSATNEIIMHTKHVEI
jgi:hypothetical protein